MAIEGEGEEPSSLEEVGGGGGVGVRTRLRFGTFPEEGLEEEERVLVTLAG